MELVVQLRQSKDKEGTRYLQQLTQKVQKMLGKGEVRVDVTLKIAQCLRQKYDTERKKNKSICRSTLKFLDGLGVLQRRYNQEENPYAVFGVKPIDDAKQFHALKEIRDELRSVGRAGDEW